MTVSMPEANPSAAPAMTAAQKEQLRQRAREAAERSYAPYSRFRVGAALLLRDGSVVTGCNVENVSYRLTCCAEQSALARAVSEHGPAIRLAAVAIANLNGTASTPCGACRQTLAEFADATLPVLYPGDQGEAQETALGTLLPHAFQLQGAGER